MAFQTILVSGKLGSISVQEAAGVVTLSAQSNVAFGGGQAAGAAALQAEIGIQLSAKQLIDLGFALAEAKFPSVAGALKGAQALIDAELAAN